MATKYTSTLDVRCGKEHTCSGCGAVYSYLFVRKVSATAGIAYSAQLNARKAADRAMATSVDPRACPTCGILLAGAAGSLQRKANPTRTVQ